MLILAEWEGDTQGSPSYTRNLRDRHLVVAREATDLMATCIPRRGRIKLYELFVELRQHFMHLCSIFRLLAVMVSATVRLCKKHSLI